MEKIYRKYFDEDKSTDDATLQLYYAGLKEEYKGNSGNKNEMYAMYKKAMALGYQPT